MMKKKTDFEKQEELYKVYAKKDKRTKAQLLLLLDATQGHVEMMIQKQINPPIVVCPDNKHYEAGYKAGVEAALESVEENKKWWKWLWK